MSQSSFSMQSSPWLAGWAAVDVMHCAANSNKMENVIRFMFRSDTDN